MNFLTDINFWVGVAAIPLGLWAVYLALRHRDPGEISFFHESAIGLVSDIAKNIENLEIKYQGQPVSEKLQFVKAYFFNTGRKDITHEMIDHPLALRLEDGSRWVTAKIVLASPEVQAKATLNQNSLDFTFPMLRRGEFFCFEALADIPSGKDFQSVCEATHRIADTRKIPKGILSFGKRDAMLFRILMFQFVVIISLIIWQGWVSKEGDFVYKYTPDGSTNSIAVSVLPRKDGAVEVKTGKILKTSIKIFPNAEQFRTSVQITAERKPKIGVESIAMFVCLGLLLFLAVPMAFEQKRAFKARKIISAANLLSSANVQQKISG